MSENGIIAYDLAPAGCPECGRFLQNRWLLTAPSGCKTCDEAITRHRCAGRPDLESLQAGMSWECPDCGSTWTAVLEQDNCSECGQDVWRKTWETVEGDRMATAPRHEPVVFTPFRDALRGLVAAASPPPSLFFDELRNMPLPRAVSCYRANAGFTVHVKPDCRCR